MIVSAIAPERRRMLTTAASERTAALRVRQALHERLHTRLRDARFETDRLFGLLRSDSLLARPVADRQRLIFYLGHLEAFDSTLLCRDGLGMRPFNAEFDAIFLGDTNPMTLTGPFKDHPSDWPSAPSTRQYGRKVRAAIDSALEAAAFGGRVSHPTAGDVGAIELAIQHRLMIAEQLAVLIHHLPLSGKSRGPLPVSTEEPSPQRWIDFSAGKAILGFEREANRFAHDNEYGAHEVPVKAFAIQSRNVTNSDFLKFVEAGGYKAESLWSSDGWKWRKAGAIQHPAFWSPSRHGWQYKAMFGEIPLPPALPVYVSRYEAEAYARWNGSRLPTEAEFHRAAFGSTTQGSEGADDDRSFPWGETAPWPSFGLFGFERWDAHPVASHLPGDTPSGISDLVGNGWEWTSSPFRPHPGFTPVPARPHYSEAAFEGKHGVLKGASPRTAMTLIRRSFRHFAVPGHQHGYSTFRCVKSAD